MSLTTSIQQFGNHLNPLQKVSLPHTAATHDPALARARTDYAHFCKHYFAHYHFSACARFHLEAAQVVLGQPHYHGIWAWFRGAAKSTHANLLLPLWLMLQHEQQLGLMLVVGRSAAAARRQLRDIQLAFEHNTKICDDLQVRVQQGHWRQGSFQVHYLPRDAQHKTLRTATFVALGVGQSPRGLRAGADRPDYIVCDDIDHRALSQNPSLVHSLTQWVLEDLLGTLATARGRFVLVGNRFSHHTVLHSLERTGRFDVRQVNAYKQNGHTPTWPKRYNTDWLARRRHTLGYHAFVREYMNQPIEEGLVFKHHWIQWCAPLPYDAYDQLICYIDPSYTSGPQADYKAAKLWGRVGAHYHQLRAFVRQCPLQELVAWCYALWDEVQAQAPRAALVFYMESVFLQDMLRQAFDDEGQRRGQWLPLRRDQRAKPAKYARIEALAALYEYGRLHYATDQQQSPDMQTGIAQLLAMAPGSRAHDDGPDADEGALWLLQRQHQHSQASLPIVVQRGPHRW